jgi:hypothetical protein
MLATLWSYTKILETFIKKVHVEEKTSSEIFVIYKDIRNKIRIFMSRKLRSWYVGASKRIGFILKQVIIKLPISHDHQQCKKQEGYCQPNNPGNSIRREVC